MMVALVAVESHQTLNGTRKCWGEKHTFVDALLALGVLGVGTWLLVVELAERCGVEMGSNAQNPHCWDAVERL